MRLGGVDPSILRELSGVYKPFVKAFKELISNAFDADAERVAVRFSDDFARASVTDDGVGMTPFDFRNDFTRIGGGSRRWSGDRTRKGRLRIGSKGIGFLALARYCGRMKVTSTAARVYQKAADIAVAGKAVSLNDCLGIQFPAQMLRQRLKCDFTAGKRRLKEGRDYRIDHSRALVSFVERQDSLRAELSFDCVGVVFNAVLDFDHLLRLADSADLETVENFATLEVTEQHRQVGTEITIEQIKPFVVRDLRMPRRKGFIRNIGSFGGLERFIWQLSRCTPIQYREMAENDRLLPLLKTPAHSELKCLTVEHAGVVADLKRPTYPMEPDCQPLLDDLLEAININEGGLRAHGYIGGYTGVIFPAEYRGVSIRVRGVAIGDPSFLHVEHLLTGANKAALSQITGEVIVTAGLDAIDTLNPGRESFYEESDHFKILKRHLVGEGEHVGGAVGKAISAVLRRSQVESALADVLGRASIRRRAVDDVSAAVTHLLAKPGPTAQAIRKMLNSKAQHTNGLVGSPPLDFGLPPRIGGLSVLEDRKCSDEARVDYAAGVVRVNTLRPEWSWRVQLHDRSFELLHRRGQPDHPIAEVDFQAGKIYINWGHCIKQQFDERGFLRFALAWVLAKETAARNGTQLMDLALEILSFAVEKNA